MEAEYGNVVTRFPPEPNGYPHIGHAKAAVIDEEYAKKYGGKLILRYDDTNPVKEKIEYYDAILEGIKWLKIEPSIIKNTSDDIEILYEHGKNLIKKNCAYVCECNSELIKKNRMNGISCICRTNAVDINLTKFQDMILGKYGQNECIVRYRGDMKSLNTAMRDPTLFRIIKGYHPKLNNRYHVWPTYDFAAPIEDSLDGVTHAFIPGRGCAAGCVRSSRSPRPRRHPSACGAGGGAAERQGEESRRVRGQALGEPGESLSRVAMHAHGLPAPRLQPWLGSRPRSSAASTCTGRSTAPSAARRAVSRGRTHLDEKRREALRDADRGRAVDVGGSRRRLGPAAATRRAFRRAGRRRAVPCLSADRPDSLTA